MFQVASKDLSNHSLPGRRFRRRLFFPAAAGSVLDACHHLGFQDVGRNEDEDLLHTRTLRFGLEEPAQDRNILEKRNARIGPVSVSAWTDRR